MAARNLSRAEKYLGQDYFRRNAFFIICEMVRRSPTHPSVLVDEVLHSIFFLGIIHEPQYYPKDILRNRELRELIKYLYQRPFQLYSTQIPKRCPISCFLDMIMAEVAERNGQPPAQEETKRQIIEHLRNLMSVLREDEAKDLTSSAICVSQREGASTSDSYFGVSMSTSGAFPGRIMVAASCLETWDSYVADAVMTYNLDNRRKRGSFDGTLQLQGLIRCEAFSLLQERALDPCRSCGDLFGLETLSIQKWPYGNCAEAESISKLLARESRVKEQIQRKPEYTEDGKQGAQNSVRTELKILLRNAGFLRLDLNFYTPVVKTGRLW